LISFENQASDNCTSVLLECPQVLMEEGNAVKAIALALSALFSIVTNVV